MSQKKEPENIEWVVTGHVVFSGATCIVHAKTRQEAISKATKGDYIGEIEIECSEVTDFSGRRAEPNVDDWNG